MTSTSHLRIWTGALLIAALFVTINLIVDVLYLVIDPRLRGRSQSARS